MAKFWITQSHYIQQRGQDAPEYVVATPARPALIDLPDGIKPSRNMRPSDDAPEKPAPAHATKTPVDPVKKSPEAIKGKRAADQ